ncbi:MAG TPA: TetR/AcrR family transcriptional regulator [Solirubrobacteraceae bacterium]|nr:TetR/AcrR family transcriptional regulator [Solirubrobacteraceae bacterium]
MPERQVTGRPRRGERRLITRAQLLDAAERVFARDGLRGASVDTIALEAGYSTGAVYSNFKGKEDLFMTLLEERIDPRLAKVYEALEAELAAGVPPLEAARRFVSLLRGERDAFLLLIDFWGQAVRDPTAAERFAQRHARLRAVVGRLLDAAIPERDTRPTLPTDQLATVLIALGNGFAIDLLADPDAVPDDLFGHALGALVQGSRAPQ